MTPSPARPETDAAPTQAATAPVALPTTPPTLRQMPCPQCGHPMPDLKGGKASICTNCGYKDSCCY